MNSIFTVVPTVSTAAGKLEFANEMLKVIDLFSIPPELTESYLRFGIPIMGETFFGGEGECLIYKKGMFLNPRAIFSSPLDTKLGKSLYGG